MCSSRKYPYSPMEGFLFCTLPPPGNSSLVSYVASKILTFKTPLPLGISNDLPWGGYGFFSGTAEYGVSYLDQEESHVRISLKR